MVCVRYIEPKLAYEVNLLGSQTIKDLMRMFHCENDYVCLKDTPHPDSHKEDPTQYAKVRLPINLQQFLYGFNFKVQ